MHEVSESKINKLYCLFLSGMAVGTGLTLKRGKMRRKGLAILAVSSILLTLMVRATHFTGDIIVTNNPPKKRK